MCRRNESIWVFFLKKICRNISRRHLLENGISMRGIPISLFEIIPLKLRTQRNQPSRRIKTLLAGRDSCIQNSLHASRELTRIISNFLSLVNPFRKLHWFLDFTLFLKKENQLKTEWMLCSLSYSHFNLYLKKKVSVGLLPLWNQLVDVTFVERFFDNIFFELLALRPCFYYDYHCVESVCYWCFLAILYKNLG